MTSIFFPNMAIPTGSVAMYINGKPFAWVTGFEYTISVPKEELRGLDSVIPVELSPTVQSIMGSVNMIRPRNSGGLEGLSVIAPADFLTNEKYFSIALLDKAAGQVIFMANKCSIMEQKWSIQSRSIVHGSFTFKALEWKNEFNAPSSLAVSGLQAF